MFFLKRNYILHVEILIISLLGYNYYHRINIPILLRRSCFSFPSTVINIKMYISYLLLYQTIQFRYLQDSKWYLVTIKPSYQMTTYSKWMTQQKASIYVYVILYTGISPSFFKHYNWNFILCSYILTAKFLNQNTIKSHDYFCLCMSRIWIPYSIWKEEL